MAAPKGNKFAEGLDNSGRPPMFTDPAVLVEKISQYFENHLPVEREVDDGVIEMVYQRPVTITGICLFLGFESRQSFYDYEDKEEFTYIIKRARLTIESIYEENLQGKMPTGSIFALKNMGWIDKQEHQIDSSGITINLKHG